MNSINIVLILVLIHRYDSPPEPRKYDNCKILNAFAVTVMDLLKSQICCISDYCICGFGRAPYGLKGVSSYVSCQRSQLLYSNAHWISHTDMTENGISIMGVGKRAGLKRRNYKLKYYFHPLYVNKISYC